MKERIIKNFAINFREKSSGFNTQNKHIKNNKAVEKSKMQKEERKRER